jgi:hypothetical protein
MNFRHFPQTALGAVATVLALAASLVACVGAADSWKEEVLLHDGQKIIVERSQTYKGRSEIGQSTPIGEHDLRFTVPGSGKRVTWTSEYADELGRTNFNLLALHVMQGTPYVVASPNLCLAYNKWGRPNPPYVVFKYESEAWKRIELSALPAEFKTINVVLSIQKYQADQLSSAGLMSAEKVKKLNEQTELPEFKTIVREKMANPVPGCGEMFGNGKGRWQGSDWFTDKPNLQACETYCKAEKYEEAYCPCKKLFERK